MTHEHERFGNVYACEQWAGGDASGDHSCTGAPATESLAHYSGVDNEVADNDF